MSSTPYIFVRLTKAQAAWVDDVFGGPFFDDTNALKENLQSYRAERGLDDAAFEKWIEDHYVNAVRLNGTTLTFDTTKEGWKQVATDLVLELENYAEIYGTDAAGLSPSKDAEDYNQLMGASRACSNAAERISLATRSQIEAVGSARTASANLQKGGAMQETNTPGKPQSSEPSQEKLTLRKVSTGMSTTNVAPPLPEGKKRTYYVKKDSKELSDKQYAVHRIADDERVSELMTKPAADKKCERLNNPPPPNSLRPGNGKRKPRQTVRPAESVIPDVAGVLGRDLTASEQGDIHAALEQEKVKLTKADYEQYVGEWAMRFRQMEYEAMPEEQKIAEQLAAWNKDATELGTDLSARIGTFKAMEPQINQVKQDFIDLKEAIDEKRCPDSTRIMPDYVWDKTNKDGKTTTAQKGFLHFEDYCKVILQRTKQAVYAMLKDAESPAEKRDPDNTPATLIKRGAAAFLKLYLLLKPQDKSVTFERLMNSIVAAARAEATERMKKEQKKNGDTEALRAIAEVTGAKHEENNRPLPPSQGLAG